MNTSSIESTSININILELAIVKKDFPRAEIEIGKLIDTQLAGRLNFLPKEYESTLSKEQVLIESTQIIERIATALTNLLSDPTYAVSREMFLKFVMNKKFLNNVFLASSYRNTEHIVRNLGLDKQTNHSRENVKRFMILIIPESNFNIPWTQLVGFMPEETIRTYLGLMFCAEFNMSELASSQLNKWAALACELPTLTFKAPQGLSIIANAYFNVSTLTGQEKYEFKKWAVKNFSNFMEEYLTAAQKQRILTVAKSPLREGKKTVLVIHERYTQNHAMYRCYHSLISSLNADYKVVGLSLKGLVDSVGKEDHSEFFEFNEVSELSPMVEKILEIKPDVILYPSLGMSNFGLLLGSLRLAPIQCVCPGHPSSTYLENIDYMLLEELGISNERLKNILNENFKVLPSLNIQISPNDYVLETEVKERYEDECHIVINGVFPKVTDQLLNVCKEVSKRSSRKVKFHFFMNSPRQDIELYSILGILRRELPNSLVHPLSDYNTYMNILNKCDFALPTLPFGGANSNVDLARLGIPKLYIFDDSDLSGVTDYYMWEQFGELDGYCESVKQLTERAIEWINDDSALELATEKVKKVDINKLLIEQGKKGDDRLNKMLNDIIADFNP